ncbi:MAG: UspA protein [Deltaproteobacteria bacterium]|nr:UspA protein [Deltaproteobacteria bacterium]
MKRILLTTDGSDFALSSAAYIANLYAAASDLEVTVLNILPPVPPLYLEEHHDPLIRKHYAVWIEETLEEAKKYTKEAIDLLQRGGFKKSHIHARHAPHVVGVARDIVREADAGHYDACAMGKKGMGWFDDTFLGSITSKLLEISEDHPIWLVSSSEWKSRNVLVAMDHTPKAVQLARYVGEMLRGLEGVTILFYHYCTPSIENLPVERRELEEIEKRIADSERNQMDHFFQEAQKVLDDLGFDKRAVEYEFELGKSASTRKVSQRILEKVQEGQYGTLVIGRKGATAAREFRLGSVASRVSTESQNCAVWVV